MFGLLKVAVGGLVAVAAVAVAAAVNSATTDPWAETRARRTQEENMRGQRDGA